MRVAAIDTVVVSVPYRHREVSSVVARDGVTDVLVKVTTDDGIVGWGESCSGPDVRSVDAAVHAMAPFVLGGDPWNRDAMRADAFHRGLWHLRPTTGNFAWAGIDMALWDICGKASGEPLYRLLGGRRRDRVDYFWYLSRGDDGDLAAQCRAGMAAGYTVFYLKVGLDFADDLAMVAAVREALGPGPRLRLDANGAWSLAEARRRIAALSEHDVEYLEQPVPEHPVSLMAELRRISPVPLIANEGLWTEADAWDRIAAGAADAYCFSPYWVGSIGAFLRLSHLAHLQGLAVLKHTHGELGIAAAACQHALLTLPNVIDGNQQTANIMDHDVLAVPLPIAAGPTWGIPEGAGLGIEVDEAAVAEAASRYRSSGQFLPWQPD